MVCQYESQKKSEQCLCFFICRALFSLNSALEKVLRILPSAQGNIVNAPENRYSPIFKQAAVPLVQKRLLLLYELRLL